MPLPSCFYLLSFLLHVCIKLFLTHLPYLFAEGLQLLPCRTRPFLICLRFFDFANGVFYLSIGSSNNLVGLCLCLANDFLTLCSQLIYLLLVLLDSLNHLLFLRVNRLPLAFPIALVACNIKQVLVCIDVFTSYELCRIGNDIFRNTNLSGNLHSKAAAWVAYLQLEECCHLLPVIKHCTIHHTRRVFSEMLEVLVVRRDDTKGSLLNETLQHSFCYCSTNSRLRATTKLVDKQE